MERFRSLDDHILVSADQILPEDLPVLAAQGVTLIVNNRPDGEEPGQPSAEQIGLAARAAGLSYRHIPVRGGFGRADIEAMAAAIDATKPGKMLAFCRAGTRSTWLWAMARASCGADPGELAQQAACAGFDLSGFAGR